jgi:hypothetical protein
MYTITSEYCRFCFHYKDLLARRGARSSPRRGYVDAGDVPSSDVLFHTAITAYVSNVGYHFNGYG